MQHLGVIMDGNGRFGVQKYGERSLGYTDGAKALVRAVKDFSELPLKYLTVYAFSTENNKRKKEEVSNIFNTIAYFLKYEIYPLLLEKSIGVRFIGDLDGLQAELKEIVRSAPVLFGEKTLIIAINYGGLNEIVRTTKKIIELGKEITEKTIREFSDLQGIPDPDAIIRYGGYRRLSNFLPMQSIYSELFFTDKKWPEYEKKDFQDIIEQYETIKRNFGE